jgi:hypothetical protein
MTELQEKQALYPRPKRRGFTAQLAGNGAVLCPTPVTLRGSASIHWPDMNRLGTDPQLC